MRLIDVRDLQVSFFTRRAVVQAVRGVSFHVDQGEVLGLVGESASGKTATCRAIVRLLPRPAGRIVGGEILFKGEDLARLTEGQMRGIRGRHISMVLQDPMTALNPALTVGDQLMEPLRLHQGLRGGDLRSRACEMLRLVQIPAPEERLAAYPHEMSGGMRQRVVGATALACAPSLLLADEPTTALDATIQAQYLRLLRDIQSEKGLSIIFVTHDFGIIPRMCDRVAVMYAGKIVETAPTRALLTKATHPYVLGLLASVPSLDASVGRLHAIKGQPPAMDNPPPGCAFAPRCESVEERCRRVHPPEVEVGPQHYSSCWRLH